MTQPTAPDRKGKSIKLVDWFVGGTAEMVVAYREDWQLYRISRQAWLVTGVYVAAAIMLLVWVIA